MKALILLVLLFGSVSIASAEVFFNDSNIVNIGEGGEPDGLAGGEDDPVIVVPDSGGSSGSDATNTEPSDSTSEPAPPESDSIESVTVTILEDEGDTTDSTESEGGSSETQEVTISASDLLINLTGDQALSTSASTGTSGSGSGSGGFGTSISADKVRQALQARGIVDISIPEPIETDQSETSSTPTRYSRGDVSLIVSALIVKNPNLDDVFFTSDTLNVQYKARGRLFFAIPIEYKTRIAINFKETEIKRRVKIDFPWFRFLMWTGVSKSGLRSTVNNAVDEALRDKTQYDAVAHVFESVSNIVQNTRGTIQGSVN